MMTARPTSIRIRLTIWYSLILACGLVFFATAVWLLMKHALYDGLRKNLTERTHSLQSFIVSEGREPGVRLAEELEEYCHALPAGTYFWISDGGQQPVFASAPAFRLPVKNAIDADFALWKIWSLPEYLVSQLAVSIRGNEYQILGAISTRQERFILHQLAILLVTLSPLVLAIAAAGGYLLSRRALRPVDEITQAAQMLSIRDLSGRLAVQRTGDELERLSDTWNSMLDRVQDAVQRLSRFTQDASHELRTPLAIIRSTAEIAARRSRTEESYRHSLQQIVDESDRLTELIEDLLLLARGDQPARPEMHEISLTEIVSNVCNEMFTLAQQKSVRLVAALMAEPAYVYGNRSLLRRLLVVLLDNAIKYSPQGGLVAVQLRDEGEELALRVEDKGLGITADDRVHIFERFYRGDAARETWRNGAGLGLSLAASIAQQHQAEIQVDSEPGRGSVFTVRLPALSRQPLTVVGDRS